MEFYEWMNEASNLKFNSREDKKEYYNRFLEEYPDFKKWLNQRTFTLWIQKYASFNGWEYKKGNSNGMQWFEIVNDDAPIVEDDGFEF